MSVQAVTWAMAADTKTSSMKLVLMCLANYAGRDGTAHPGQKSIATESKLSLRTVNTCLKRLEEDGFITRKRRVRDDGSRTSDLYQLQIDPMQPLHVEEGGNMQSTTGQHATIAHQYKPNGLSEPVSEPLDNSPKPAKRISYPSDFEEFWFGYLTDANMSKKEAYDVWKKLDSEQRRQAIASLPNFKAYCQQNDWYRPIHAHRYLLKERFAGFLSGPATGAMDIEEINRQLQA